MLMTIIIPILDMRKKENRDINFHKYVHKLGT